MRMTSSKVCYHSPDTGVGSFLSNERVRQKDTPVTPKISVIDDSPSKKDVVFVVCIWSHKGCFRDRRNEKQVFGLALVDHKDGLSSNAKQRVKNALYYLHNS